ncbi:MAG: Ada metal-binding domain-containing protein [Chloroflexota bacterium]
MIATQISDSLTHAEMLTHMYASDATYNGRFLTGVLSTGIYCLPSCTARKPNAENVRFFATEAAAQTAGLRACRRCRPDYFYQHYDPDLATLTALVVNVRHVPSTFASTDAMVSESGIGLTKLHALFRQHYHSTPAAFLCRTRIAAACRLLEDPDKQVIEVAYAVGFESLSAFHDNFRKATGLSPKDYQQLGKSSDFTVTLPENYVSWVTLKLLGRDPESRTEQVKGQSAVKALRIGAASVLLHMEFQPRSVDCHIEGTQPITPEIMRGIHAAVIRLLGLTNSPTGFERRMGSDPNLSRLLIGRHGLRIPLMPDIFEAMTWAIVGQQVNLPFAYKLRRTVVQLCGEPIGDSGFIAHPTPTAVAQLDYTDLTSRQFSRHKAEYLIDTARLISSGDLSLANLAEAPASQVEQQLLAIRGLGPWSAHYIMLRALGFADCVPLGDAGLVNALRKFYDLDHRPDSTETAALMELFAPYRSLATYHLWLTLGENPG